mmetsp:Transcript_67254/g.217055  ORF Transcript_67254/g.217055 Transcript_67254/m.217055 type:complete len:125 (+) Transcript_67254:1802-2176(+)
MDLAGAEVAREADSGGGGREMSGRGSHRAVQRESELIIAAAAHREAWCGQGLPVFAVPAMFFEMRQVATCMQALKCLHRSSAGPHCVRDAMLACERTLVRAVLMVQRPLAAPARPAVGSRLLAA